MQAAERKARFTDQLMCRRADVDETGHTGDVALSYSEVKALANRNPLLIDKARADAELARLERAERDWRDVLRRCGNDVRRSSAISISRHQS